jgi:predicted porin
MKRIKAALGTMACTMACTAAGGAAAQTNVTAMGLVDMYAGASQFSGVADKTNVVGSGGLTTSWFGFKGSEELGGGLRAEFFRGDTGSSGRFNGDNLFSRDANVGLAGSFGKVQVGRGLAPNFLPTVLFNPFGDSFTFSPLVVHADMSGSAAWGGATNAADTGWSNQVIYSSPKIGGLSANVHYQFGEVAGQTSTNNVGANLLYFSGPLGLTAFYHDTNVSNPNPAVTANKQKTAFAGASYDFKVLKVAATFQRNDNESAATGARTSLDKTASLGAWIPAGRGGSVLAAYARTKRDLATAPDLTRRTFSLGYDYALSKRTDVYAVAMNDKLSGYDDATSYGVGIRHRY